MKFCIALAYNDPLELPILARAAEEHGFAAVILSDHLVYPAALQTPYPYTADGVPRWDAATPWPDPLVMSASLAAVTERLEIIISVYVLGLRHPVLAAKAISTAAVMSGNRLVVGIGAGWMREEFDLVGASFERRGRRVEESLEVMRLLWSGDSVGFEGEFHRFDPVRMSPVPSQPVPLWGGGVSDAALRRAARACDGWLSEIQKTDEMPALIAKLRELREGSQRSDRPFSIGAAVSDAFTVDAYRRLEELGVTHLITVPWLFYGRGATVEEKVAGIERFAADAIEPMRGGE